MQIYVIMFFFFWVKCHWFYYFRVKLRTWSLHDFTWHEDAWIISILLQSCLLVSKRSMKGENEKKERCPCGYVRRRGRWRPSQSNLLQLSPYVVSGEEKQHSLSYWGTSDTIWNNKCTLLPLTFQSNDDSTSII